MFFEKSPIEVIYMGRAALAAAADALDAAAGATALNAKAIDITNSAHGWYVGSTLEITGTTNYNGMSRLLANPDANSMVMSCDAFIAETFTTADYVNPWINFDDDRRWELLQFEMHLSADGDAAENVTLQKDANILADIFDTVIYTKDTNGISDILWTPPKAVIMEGKDRLKLAWANGGTARNWGAAFWYRRER